MPVKNTSIYLAECLESILKQSYTNWELIAVDDHSTDGSKDILRLYADQDTRIQVLTNKGNGIIDGLRTAYEQSLGGYITRMDSDDIMADSKLETMMDQLVQKGKGHLALGLVEYFSAAGVGAGYLAYAKWLNGLIIEGNSWKEIYKECVVPSPCWMVSREDFEKCGGFTGSSYPEDYDLCFRFYKAGLISIPSNQVLHYWRDYGERTSRTHPHYADNRFLSMKIRYFLELDHKSSASLMLYGAGKKGKAIAALLVENGIHFEWYCDNPNKIGREISGVYLQSIEAMATDNSSQVLIAVANAEEQRVIENKINDLRQSTSTQLFFLC